MSISELLVYGLVIAAFLVFNYVTTQAARRARQEDARRAEAAGVGAADEHAWGRHPAPLAGEDIQQPAQYQWGRHTGAVPGTPTERPEAQWSTSVPVTSTLPARTTQAPASADFEQPRIASRPVPLARRLFETRSDLRRAVVAMTVLGPCRALEPPDLHEGSRPLPRSRRLSRLVSQAE